MRKQMHKSKVGRTVVNATKRLLPKTARRNNGELGATRAEAKKNSKDLVPLKGEIIPPISKTAATPKGPSKSRRRIGVGSAVIRRIRFDVSQSPRV